MRTHLEWINTVGEAVGQDMFCGDPHKPGSRTEDVIKAIQTDSAPVWQPIESAPKSGETLLLWESGDPECGHWSTSVWVTKGGAWISYESRSDTLEIEPTHWMPLPKPPTQGQRENG